MFVAKILIVSMPRGSMSGRANIPPGLCQSEQQDSGELPNTPKPLRARTDNVPFKAWKRKWRRMLSPTGRVRRQGRSGCGNNRTPCAVRILRHCRLGRSTKSLRGARTRFHDRVPLYPVILMAPTKSAELDTLLHLDPGPFHLTA